MTTTEKTYHSNGQIKTICDIVDGDKHGEFICKLPHFLNHSKIEFNFTLLSSLNLSSPPDRYHPPT